jgi:hypothetical protein
LAITIVKKVRKLLGSRERFGAILAEAEINHFTDPGFYGTVPAHPDDS